MRKTVEKTLKGLSVMALICAVGVSATGYTNVSAMQIEKFREIMEEKNSNNEQTKSQTDAGKEKVQKEESEYKAILEKNDIKIQCPKADDKEVLIYENTESFLEGLQMENWKECSTLPETVSPEVFLIEEEVLGHPDQYETVANLRYFPKEKCVAITSGSAMPNQPEEFAMQKKDTCVYKVSEDTIHFLEELQEQ